jgi:hypothetical protein
MRLTTAQKALSNHPTIAAKKPAIVEYREILTLNLNLNTTPEGNIASNIFGGFFGFGVVPGGIAVGLAIDDNVVIAGDAFPAAGGVGAAGLEIVHVDAVGWEVLVAFDDFAAITLSNYDAVPSCFGHGGFNSLFVWSLDYSGNCCKLVAKIIRALHGDSAHIGRST